MAVVYLVVGLWILSVLDASGKFLVMAGLSVWLVTWVRYFLHLCLVLALRFPYQGWSLLRPVDPVKQIIRGVVMLASTMFFFTTLKYLPLANATAVNFTAPLVVLLVSPLVLRERPKLRRFVAAAIALCGVLMVVRPSLELPWIGLLMSGLTALTFATYQMLTRAVAKEDVYTTSTFGALVTLVCLTPCLPFLLSSQDLANVLSDHTLIWVLLSTGLTGFVGHICQIAAYKRWEASRLAPFVYLQIVAALLLGWLIFNNIPDATSLLGIGIIVFVGIIIALLERRHDA
jgi:drug/metabolite transporter (DMT)-like permease